MKSAAKRRDPSRPRRCREATTEVILDAAEKVFSLHGLDGASVRMVAAEAGVTHALVHRYFGTKTGLYRAVLARNENVIRDAAAGIDELTEAMSLMMREGLAHHRAYLRLIVASALGGVPYDRSIVSFGATERLIELARSAATEGGQSARRGDRAASAEAAEADRRLAIAMAVALYLGWVALEPWLVKATRIEHLGEEMTTDGLERAMRSLLEGWLGIPPGSRGA